MCHADGRHDPNLGTKGCFSNGRWVMLESSVLKGCSREVMTRSPPSGGARVWALVVPLVLQAGCAAAPAPEAAAPPPLSPEAEANPEPQPLPTLNLTELESLEHDLSVSEARLDEELARQAATSDGFAEPPAAEPTVPQKSADSAGSGAARGPARPERRPATEPPGRSATDPESVRLGSPCDLGCRALASMQRAQVRICEIAGANERCQRATERVQAAVGRVRSAGCECRADDR